MNPEPQPSGTAASGIIHQRLERARPSAPPPARMQPASNRTDVPNLVVAGPLLALATKYAMVQAASSRPRPASGAPSDARICGQATPMAPAGSPSAMNSMSGVLALAQVPDPEGRQRFGSITREMLEGYRWIRGSTFWVEEVASNAAFSHRGRLWGEVTRGSI